MIVKKRVPVRTTFYLYRDTLEKLDALANYFNESYSYIIRVLIESFYRQVFEIEGGGEE